MELGQGLDDAGNECYKLSLFASEASVISMAARSSTAQHSHSKDYDPVIRKLASDPSLGKEDKTFNLHPDEAAHKLDIVAKCVDRFAEIIREEREHEDETANVAPIGKHSLQTSRIAQHLIASELAMGLRIERDILYLREENLEPEDFTNFSKD